MQKETDMQSTAALAERLSSDNNKRRNIVISAAAGLVLFIALLVVILTSARSPEILSQQFTDNNAAGTFATTGAGTWQVNNGMYELKQPATLASTANGNISLSAYQKKFTSNEWELEVDAKALDTTTPHDFSVVFDYINEYNYTYANYSDKNEEFSNGIFKVSNGQVTSLTKFPSTISTGQTYAIELRKKGDEVKAYRDKAYLAKATTGKISTDVRVGFGSRGGTAVFDNLFVRGEGGTGGTTTPKPDPTPTPPPTPTPAPNPTPAPTPTPTPNGGRTVNVTNGDQLTAALADARPGDVINLADGTYKAKGSSVNVGDQAAGAKFRISKSGTADKPIVIQGSRKAIIDGESAGGDYGLHVYKASHIQIKGIRVTTNKKGIIFDGSSNNLVDGVMVDNVGNEAVHFRTNSSNNVLKGSFITKTGVKTMGYGEGAYIGSDSGNWAKLNGGAPDQSDNNQIIGNTFTEFTAEGIDIKEASNGNTIKDNYFDGASLGGTSKANSADSWIDIKGDNNLTTGNSGVNVFMFDKSSSAAFQTHVHGPSGYNSASNNTFTKNKIDLNGPGYGFFLDPNGKNNVVSCDNIVMNAGKGFGNIACKP